MKRGLMLPTMTLVQRLVDQEPPVARDNDASAEAKVAGVRVVLESAGIRQKGAHASVPSTAERRALREPIADLRDQSAVIELSAQHGKAVGLVHAMNVARVRGPEESELKGSEPRPVSDGMDAIARHNVLSVQRAGGAMLLEASVRSEEGVRTLVERLVSDRLVVRRAVVGINAAKIEGSVANRTSTKIAHTSTARTCRTSSTRVRPRGSQHVVEGPVRGVAQARQEDQAEDRDAVSREATAAVRAKGEDPRGVLADSFSFGYRRSLAGLNTLRTSQA